MHEHARVVGRHVSRDQIRMVGRADGQAAGILFGQNLNVLHVQPLGGFAQVFRQEAFLAFQREDGQGGGERYSPTTLRLMTHAVHRVAGRGESRLVDDHAQRA